MGSTKHFFRKKKEWSKFKDRILDYYLTPYMTKILHTRKSSFVIDCFAGRGKFEDGSVGSPLIIAEHIKSILDNPKNIRKEIFGIFIEKKYANFLDKNAGECQNCKVIKGTFEDNVENILKLDSRVNIFMYVDPYGIKSLEFKNFDKITSKNFYSLELLMNFNSFGFLREGCRILGKNFSEELIADDGEIDYELDEERSETIWNQIANGNYWKDILIKKKNGEIDMYQAEEMFIKKYVEQLKDLFRYVVHIPIKLKTTHVPKYRLIFGTNHFEGLEIMINGMNKAWKKIQEEERKGQFFLFEWGFPDSSLAKGFNLQDDIIKVIKQEGKSIKIKKLFVKLIEKYGIYFPISTYNRELKAIDGGRINIRRIPEFTAIKKKKATSMDYRKYDIRIELV